MEAAFAVSAAPQSSQNTDEGAFSELHCGQRWDNGLPHVAQNFLPVVLSDPHCVQRIGSPAKNERSPLYITRWV